MITKIKSYNKLFLTNKYNVFIGNLIAKKNNTSIQKHNEEIAFVLDDIIKNRQYIIKKYCLFFNVTYDEFIKTLTFIIVVHDFGKTYVEWQTFLQNDNKKAPLRHEFHSFINILKYQLRRLGIKYSQLSYKECIDHIKEYYYIYIPVLSHHNHFNYEYIKNYEGLSPEIPHKANTNINDFAKIWDIVNHNFNYENLNSDFKYWYKQQIFRYFLNLGDKTASALNENNSLNLPKFSIFNFKDVFCETYKPIQKLILKNSEKDVLMLRSSTGSGKTYAAILWGNKQIVSGFADRIVIALPTQFTSNKITSDISEYVMDSNVLHSNISLNKKYKDLSYQEKYFALKHDKNFESNVTVATIDQLLIASSLRTEINKNMFFNLVNSCVVIDEADFYDETIIANIIRLITILKQFNVKVLIMSATIPDSFVNIFNKFGNFNIEKIIDETSNNFIDKVNINSISDQWYEKLDNIKNYDNTIVYCNTVNRAIETYNYLIDNNISNGNPIILYHSYYLLNDKISKETDIINLFGKEAWENNIPKGIIIMTQIGELSLNISADYILTDIAPLDRLVQRFGRGCRFNGKICNVDIIIPMKNNKMFLFPYVNDDLKTINYYLEKTINILKVGTYNNDLFLQMINHIYENYNLTTFAIHNSFSLHPLLLRRYQFFSERNNEENDNLQQWTVRNVSPIMQVLINDELFLNQNYNVKHYQYTIDCFNFSLSIPIYRFNKYLKNNIIIKKEILVDNNIITVYIISEEYYNTYIGLDLLKMDSNSKNNYQII